MRGLNVRLSDWANRHHVWFTLLVGLLGGLVGVAVDFDHLWKPSRQAHIPLLIASVLVAVYCLARIRGLSNRLVLKKDCQEGITGCKEDCIKCKLADLKSERMWLEKEHEASI